MRALFILIAIYSNINLFGQCTPLSNPVIGITNLQSSAYLPFLGGQVKVNNVGSNCFTECKWIYWPKQYTITQATNLGLIYAKNVVSGGTDSFTITYSTSLRFMIRKIFADSTYSPWYSSNIVNVTVETTIPAVLSNTSTTNTNCTLANFSWNAQAEYNLHAYEILYNKINLPFPSTGISILASNQSYYSVNIPLNYDTVAAVIKMISNDNSYFYSNKFFIYKTQECLLQHWQMIVNNTTNSNNHNANLYNPTTKNELVKIVLYSSSGAKIQEQNIYTQYGNNPFAINLTNHTQGVYIAKAYLKGSVIKAVKILK